MLDIIVLLILRQSLSGMARRRGLNATGYTWMLVLLWFGGQIGGFLIGLGLAAAIARGDAPNLMVAYGVGLAGAAFGALLTFGIVAAKPSIEAPEELPEQPVGRSRLVGVIAGSIGGLIIGGAMTYFLYGGARIEGNLPMVLQGAVAAGTVGALLGLVAGVQRE
jgi:hypothetical protein